MMVDSMSPRRRRLRRGVVILPSAFTLGNLFLGIWAIVNASRGEYFTAGWMIVGAAIMDLLDGRIARFTATGSAFGEELDSLVDAISFGVAPALIAYFAFFSTGGEWSWILAFLYIVAAVFRLARFNIEQAGTAKAAFHGLPSPTAGACLATYYAFTETPFWAAWLPHVPVVRMAGWLLMLLGVLMVSNVLYPVVPRFGTRTWSGRFAIFLAIVSLVSAFTYPAYFFFPFSMLYITYGLVKSVLGGFEERLPARDPLEDEVDDGEADDMRELEYEEMRPKPGLREPMDSGNQA
ncbi:MAG TPA: CDP-diacylglycerol--serine O-phosphatidyltransferase [Longimicrobium sp.]|jgi:CDP-diacylglycerol--serine O-phosphatidyltransferase|uniref:CDP-diacylglycerol--serine O-phosphatidyltransferase n=1 Tax=Longimicrobium sp. TaxID=2029185 RepID=UPI002EDB93FE